MTRRPEMGYQHVVGMVEFGLNGVACIVLLPYTGCSVQRVLFPHRGEGKASFHDRETCNCSDTLLSPRI